MRRRRLGIAQRSIPEAAVARNIFAKKHLPALPTAEVSSQLRIQKQTQLKVNPVQCSKSAPRQQHAKVRRIITELDAKNQVLNLGLQGTTPAVSVPPTAAHGNLLF
ncbi:hypothetical protein EVAR_5864_1 [Eumeta japonica]|uniref:Uncharacterized protein n=1 Tax=Eumeta variegata TaxID=151549 RepID=A0A4C1TD43_EUMVA|nr:hypothetical protein EVAR_5864_1 [Eumeta japonica]